jgi:hypothetical protein
MEASLLFCPVKNNREGLVKVVKVKDIFWGELNPRTSKIDISMIIFSVYTENIFWIRRLWRYNQWHLFFNLNEGQSINLESLSFQDSSGRMRQMNFDLLLGVLLATWYHLKSQEALNKAELFYKAAKDFSQKRFNGSLTTDTSGVYLRFAPAKNGA